jgi:hypothetical protein
MADTDLCWHCGHARIDHYTGGAAGSVGPSGADCTRCVFCREFSYGSPGFPTEPPPPAPPEFPIGTIDPPAQASPGPGSQKKAFISGAVVGAVGTMVLMLFNSGVSVANYELARRQTAAIERMATAFEHGALRAQTEGVVPQDDDSDSDPVGVPVMSPRQAGSKDQIWSL